jgi:hypothetical protein
MPHNTMHMSLGAAFTLGAWITKHDIKRIEQFDLMLPLWSQARFKSLDEIADAAITAIDRPVVMTETVLMGMLGYPIDVGLPALRRTCQGQLHATARGFHFDSAVSSVVILGPTWEGIRECAAELWVDLIKFSPNTHPSAVVLPEQPEEDPEDYRVPSRMDALLNMSGAVFDDVLSSIKPKSSKKIIGALTRDLDFSDAVLLPRSFFRGVSPGMVTIMHEINRYRKLREQRPSAATFQNVLDDGKTELGLLAAGSYETLDYALRVIASTQ